MHRNPAPRPNRARLAPAVVIATIFVLLHVSGCQTRVWGEAGGGQPARGGISVPLGGR